MLEQEIKYFAEHKKELFDQYIGKYISIVGETVFGAFETENEAFISTSKKHPVGTFLIKLCDEKADAYKQTFHSRVSFV